MSLVHQTNEGGQELAARSELTAKELLREVGSVLRMSEAEVADMARANGFTELYEANAEDEA